MTDNELDKVKTYLRDCQTSGRLLPFEAEYVVGELIARLEAAETVCSEVQVAILFGDRYTKSMYEALKAWRAMRGQE